jgi:hypothetical protein
MPAASYNNSQLVEIIRNALARWLAGPWAGLNHHGKTADDMLAEGFDLNTAYAALRRHLHHLRAQSRPPDSSAARLAAFMQQQRMHEEFAILRADVLAVLRAALTPTGPFITIPKLGKAFHIRYRSDLDYNGIEIVTADGIRPGRDVVVRLRDDPGGRPTVPQELIDELDRKACATLTAAGKPLAKKARADLIEKGLSAKGLHLAVGTIKNRLNAKRP